MDNKALLVKSVSLLFKESLLENNKDNSADLVRSVLETIQVAELGLAMNTERDIIVGLKHVALEMCENPIDYKYDKETFLTTIRMCCGDDNRLYNNFVSLIDPELDSSCLLTSIVNLRKSLSNYFRENKINDILYKTATQFRFARDKIPSVTKFLQDFIAELTPYQDSDETTEESSATINVVNMDDVEDSEEMFNQVTAMEDGKSIMKTGWQGLNRMLQGGFREGDFCVIGALQHNYKTGFTMNLFKQFALYNKPNLIDPTKKPLLLRLSFEDPMTSNMQFLYQSLKENETGKKAIVKGQDPKEMATYLKEKMTSNGWSIKMMRVDPTQWGYRNVCNLIMKLEQEGYEIKVLVLDYLALMTTAGCTQGATGADVQDLFRRMRMFTNPRKIICITPHQLSSEANQLARDGRQNFVKEVASKNYWEKSKGISREVDIEIIINIEKLNKVSYLTMQLGKHRLPTIAPEDHKYMVLRFHDIGGVLDDMGKPESTLIKVGGGPIGDPNAEHTPFWLPQPENLKLPNAKELEIEEFGEF